MGYSQMAASQLKWPEFLGGAAGALFCKEMRVRFGWHLKTLAFTAMAAVVMYNVMMAGLMTSALSIHQLWPPLFVLGFGHVSLFIALTVYAQAYCNFKYYFQVLCILGLIRTGIGDPIGIAIWEHALSAKLHGCDMLTALRGLYQDAVIFGVGVLVLILCSHFDRLRNPLPTLRQAYIIVERTLQTHKKTQEKEV
jgi:hypothetical protein